MMQPLMMKFDSSPDHHHHLHQQHQQFCRYSNILASGGRDATIKIWNLTTGSEIVTISGHEQTVSTIAFNSKNTLLVSGSHDNTVKIWDITGVFDMINNPLLYSQQYSSSSSLHTLLHTLTEHSDVVCDVAWHHSDQLVH
jgi:WD40 repeat protein